MSRIRGLTVVSIVAMTMLLLLATVGTAAAATRFGAKLGNTVQPTGVQSCIQPDPAPYPSCTWVMGRAKNRGLSGHKAPKDGTIDKVRVNACEPGSFKIQIAKLKSAAEQAKVLRNGPTVNYAGDPDGCSDNDYKTNVVNVPNFHVNKREVIAIKTKQTGAISDTSGGNSTFQFFDPPLPAGGPFRDADDTDGLFLLVEWQYTN